MADRTAGKLTDPARRREIAIGAILVVVALLIAFILIPAGVKQPSSVRALPLSPVFLPYILTGLVAVFGLLHIVGAWMAPDSSALSAAELEANATHPRWMLRFAVLVLGLGAYLLLPEFAGMLGTSIVVTVALIALGGERRPAVLLGIGLIMPLVVWLFFTQVAQVPLPVGTLWEG